MLKIALLNSVCYGSTGSIACNLARLYQKNGYETTVFFGRGTAPADVHAERVETTAEVAAHVAKARLMDCMGFGSALATKQLVQKLEAWNPDVIHLHNIHGYWVHVGILFDALKKMRKPVLWTFHDCWPFTGHCAYFDLTGCDRWKNGCGACPQKNGYPQRWLFDQSAKRWNQKQQLFSGLDNLTIVTPSNWLKDLIEQSFLREYNVRVFPNGIDTGVFQPTENQLRSQHHLENGRIFLGVASVWDERKNLAAFSSLRPKLPQEDHLVVIGLNSRQMASLPAGILGLPRTENARQLAAWYTAADVFVDPTLEDNFPTTHLEALSCGTPVVTYATGGSAEMLTPACGAAVQTGDLDALYTAMLRAADLRREDCLKQAQNYDQHICLQRYADLCSEIVCTQ